MKIHVGQHVTIDRAGRHGVRAAVEFGPEHGLSAVYAFHTHGLSADEVARRRQSIVRYHERKCARVAGFVSLRGQSYTLGPRDSVLITDCTIIERGAHPALLVLATLNGTERFELLRDAENIEKLPDDATIIQSVLAAARARLQQLAAVDRHRSEVQVALQGV